jgi:molecular chaperone DnaK
MAVIEEGKPVIIPNAEGERLTPSVVACAPHTCQLLVGTPAKRQAAINPQNTVSSAKRFLGRRSDDPIIRHDLELASCQTRTADNGSVSVWLAERWCSPQEILATILQKLKRDAEIYLGEPVTQAVITVPAYFIDCQRQAVMDACRVAGLEALRIINESTAACLAYGFGREADEMVAVYHLGGGTFDISILYTDGSVFEVRSTSGDTHLGGDDWDQRVVDYVAGEFQNNQGIDLRRDPQALQRLKEACERAKIELSTATETVIDLPFIGRDGAGFVNLQIKLTRAKLEQLTKDLVERTMAPCRRAVGDASCARDGSSEPLVIDRVILVGQQTRMPAVQRVVKEFFGKDPCWRVDPAEAVALGAAVQAGVLGGKLNDVLLLDITPFTLSVETLGGVSTALIHRNTTIPTRQSQVFSTVNDGQTSVDIKIYQGEHPMATDNVLLGQFRLDGIRPAPRKTPQIEVTFDIDANSIFNVFAKDKATGREQRMLVVAPDGRLVPADFGRCTFVSRADPVATTKMPATPPKKERPEDSVRQEEGVPSDKKRWQFWKKPPH